MSVGGTDLRTETTADTPIVDDSRVQLRTSEHHGPVGKGAGIPAGAADPAVLSGPTQIAVDLRDPHSNALADHREIIGDGLERSRGAHLTTAHTQDAGPLSRNDVGCRPFRIEGVYKANT